MNTVCVLIVTSHICLYSYLSSYAPWCPACRALHPTWIDYSDWTEDLGLTGIAQVDVTENPGLSGRFLVTALPTIYQ